MSKAVEIFEVGPRDGLQNELAFISSEDKIALTQALAGAGLLRIECASFVSPKWVPQMADAAQVAEGVTPGAAQLYALAPNNRGLRAALATPVGGLCVFIAATEGFSRANTNISLAGAVERVQDVIATFRAEAPKGVRLRGYISCVTECPYDGPVAPSEVARLAELLHGAGCDEISLGDTIGTAYPEQVARLLEAVVQVVPAEALAGHYHDTTGRALANIDVSLDYGLRVFDASIAGLGGCPYAPGAKGNVDTELVYDHLVARGYDISGAPDRAGLAQAARLARKILGRTEGAKDAI
ncbi:3-hydroxy-3-isohexenylglutaryl-CoA/hydroxy-methylglutaryl-CoA lyase [Rhodobacteraceae bacterium IMCC1933]|nr:3-hydroxy-3-isohexenylglutaryl-CoA/hydroxy-methylglutaryl-CoA lyase [Rhodobacteraceae bacterium IMCC1923]MDP4068498.1 3-hydroxy-3-isohexenylglutaryl-CoA/hydroxy-methylglutaryl-CoA lyase [Rhodobacteraceae bacterium IMCC1933]MDP4070363.1 3-hydroxy-3-isohexenylglutaryl-CoA/hydroxy-methylglutaryl-CoA lyase [Rhodobacteraceae bacterium IMCC1909]